jgi:Ca-activated chloride channel homolog
MIPTFARTWMLAVGVLLVVVPSVVTIATRRRGWLRPGGLAVALFAAALVLYEGLVQAGVVRETYVRFRQPQALLLVAGLAILVGVRLSRLPRRMRTGRRRAFALLSAAATLGAALVVAEPELGTPLDRTAIVVLVDRSRSIELVPNADARIRSELQVAEKSMHEDDLVATIVFGAEPAAEDPLHSRREATSSQRVEVGRDATDIDSAIRRGLAELPADAAGRLVLLSDGVQTRGDALAAATVAVAADVPIDVVPLDQKLVPDVRVVAVRAPGVADEGEALELRVVTGSSVETDVELRVRRDGGEARVLRAHIGKGEDVLRIHEVARDPGLHRFDVAVTAIDPAADLAPEDNAGSAFVRVRGEALALVLEGDVGHGAPLRKALEASGFRTIEQGTTGVPADVGGLAPYDLVVLSDIRGSDLSPSQIAAMATYARDLGGGLVLMGGDRSMGPGGYARTPIEEVSPVAFDLKQEKRRASLAEVIAIDYSGSMGAMAGAHTKLDLANEAAARSASLLGPGDRLGVEHVDTLVRWTVPMAPVNDASAISEAIRGVSVGGGGIYTDLALRAGYDALARESVNLKHLLLFADGSDAEQIGGCRAIVRDAFDHGVTTSVISLGRGSDSPELEALSKVGGGRFYLIEDANKLPAVFAQETILAARSAVHEVPFRALLGVPGPPTRGIDFGKQPPLDGYVVTMPKPRASILLGAEDNDPLLATWSVGIGRTAAFTSDYKDRWGREWLTWPEAARMFGQLARDIARKSDDPRVRLEADATGAELHVRADVVGDDGRAQTFRRLTVHVAGPDGLVREVPLEATGAGRYAATLPIARPGTYVATAKDDVSGEPVGTVGAALTASEELRPTGSDRALLERIAATTGGRARDTLAGLFDERAARRFAYRALAPQLAILSALAMLFGVAARRAGIPDWVSASVGRVHAWREDGARRRRERAASLLDAQELAVAERERLRDAIVRRRRVTPAEAEQSLPPLPITRAIPPRASAARPPAAPDVGSDERPLTAAERLALRRRQRK